MIKGMYIDYDGSTDIECPFCGKKDSFKGNLRERVCPKCGETYYLFRERETVLASDNELEINRAEEAYEECNWSADDYKNYYGDDLENMSDD